MSDLMSQWEEELEAKRQKSLKAGEREASRLMGEHGVFTLSLVVGSNGEWRRQQFGSMNAVDSDVAKWVAGQYLRAKYGICDIDFRQSKAERISSTEDRVYFHAMITNIKGHEKE